MSIHLIDEKYIGELDDGGNQQMRRMAKLDGNGKMVTELNVPKLNLANNPPSNKSTNIGLLGSARRQRYKERCSKII